jgi:hypothetical protein
VAQGAYDSEYDFGWDLHQTTQQTHEGHFAYVPHVVSQFFTFGRTTPLVSVSKDGKDLPLVYAYADILSSYAGNVSFEPSHIVLIDGTDTTDFLLDLTQYSRHQDKDALWNNLFYSVAQISQGGLGSGTGTFTGNSDARFVYPGPTTTLTFANGSEAINENFARVLFPMNDIESGADLYREFHLTSPEDYRTALEVLNSGWTQTYDKENKYRRVPDHDRSVRPPYLEAPNGALSSQRHTSTILAIGYPTPIIRQKQNMNAGYFLEEPGFEDVAVLTVASFYTVTHPAARDFQKINSDFISAALAANKTKLIIDCSANGGGALLQGYDLFKQLFPSIHPYGASRIRAHETINLIGEIYSAPENYSDPWRKPSGDELIFNYGNDLDSDDKKFKSWDQKYGPHPQGPGNDTFTSLIRWDLNDSRIERDAGIWVTGYGQRSNTTSQPFQAQNIVLVTDGFCASTCALFSEFLRQEANVQTNSLGGRPSRDPMQTVGGTKGAEMLTWSRIFENVRYAGRASNNTALQQVFNETVLQRYSLLPMSRGISAVNYRDGIRRNDDGQTPYQFLYEPAECRIFYTKQMVMDPSVMWKTVADTVWGEGNACIAGNNSFIGKQGDVTAESEAGKQKMWSVRHDFDINEAWKGLEIETDSDWFGGIGGYVMAS